MKKFYPLFLALLLAGFFLAACGGTATEEPAAEASTEENIVSENPAAEPEQEPEPTDEPMVEVEAPTTNLTDACVENYDEAVDYFPQKTAVSHADGFTIEYFNNYKVVTVAAPWLGATDSATYVLVQCGTPNPPGFDDAVIFDVPISSFVSMSTTYLPHLEQFGLLDSLVGVDFASYAYNATVQEKYAAGELVELGNGATVDVEAALALEPHIIMTSASGSADFDTHPKLQEVGLTVLLNADYLDVTPLGRAEWAKFIAVLYNEEAQANDWFNGVTVEFESLAAITIDVADRPTVFANTPFEGTWYMPGGKSYTALLLDAAGADYLWGEDESTSTLFLDFESVFDQAADSTYWINLGFLSSLADLELADERFADFAAFQNGTVYNYDLRTNEFGGNDFFESGAANPHWVLADLIKIFHPELVPDHEFVYYQLVE